MKKRLLKNGLFATLGVVSATIPLVSVVGCSKKENNTYKVGSEFDKEYGIDAAVYKKLKATFMNKVINNPEKPLSPEEKAFAKNDLNSAFKMFDAQFKKQNLSYTAVTNSMIEYAYRAYDIKLEREKVTKTVSWDELDAAFEGMCESMKAFMSELPEDVQQAILTDAGKQYYGDSESKIKGLKNEIIDKYADPLMALVTAKSKLWACFAGVNKNIALVSGAIRLHDFLDNHEVSYDTKTTDADTNKYDNFSKQQWFKEALKNKGDISEHILDIFTITDKTTGEVLTTFDSTKVCPGYVVKPILNGVTADPIKNEYALNIDWTCMSNAYNTESEEIKTKVTAHMYNDADNSSFDFEKCEDVSKFFEPLRESAGINYKVILSKSGEIETLKNTYFNSAKDHIAFSWNDDESRMNSFETFFFGSRMDNGQTTGKRTYLVDTTQLATSGIRIAKLTNTSTNSDNSIRLETLINTGGQSEKEKVANDDTLINDFISNCLLSSMAIVDDTKDANDVSSVTNTIFANYANTTYKFDYANDEGTKVVDSLTKTCFRLTNVSYEALTKQVNEKLDVAESYATNIYKEQYDAVKTDLIWQSTMYGIDGLFTIWTTAFCFAPVFAAHIPVYIVLLALTWASMAAQTVILTLFVTKQWNKIKHYAEGGDKLSKDPRVTSVVESLNNVKNANSICRWKNVSEIVNSISANDYNNNLIVYGERTKDFITDILPTITELQQVSQTQQFQDFNSAIEEADCSPKDYESDMEIWDSKGWCTITVITLSSVSLALDIASCVLMFKTPEMYSWHDVKMAKAMSKATGKNWKYLVKVYYAIRRARKLQKDSKLIQMGEILLEQEGNLAGLSATDKLVDGIVRRNSRTAYDCYGSFDEMFEDLIHVKYREANTGLVTSDKSLDEFLDARYELWFDHEYIGIEDFIDIFARSRGLFGKGQIKDWGLLLMQRMAKDFLNPETRLGAMIANALTETANAQFKLFMEAALSETIMKNGELAVDYFREAENVLWNKASFAADRWVSRGNKYMGSLFKHLYSLTEQLVKETTAQVRHLSFVLV